MTRAYDAIVIGAGVNGLAAASYLAMAGKSVIVLEARDAVGGLCDTGRFGDGFLHSRAAHTLYALDPVVIKELKLSRHGLRFAVRDMPLVGLRSDGKHLVLTRDVRTSARQIAHHSEADASAWAQYRRDWFALARAMRSHWWRASPKDARTAASDERVARLARMGACAWLDSRFESDALKATLGFDAHALSPLAAGSALLLLWRAAQEMCGLQGAVAVPRGGFRTVADAFAGAARSHGAELRTGARVADVSADRDGAITGVALASGETIAAPLVLSSLSRRATLSFVGAVLGFGEAADLARVRRGTQMARVTLALDSPPVVAGSTVPQTARFIVAERLESLVAAHGAAHRGALPQELTMEVTIPSAADASLAPAGRHLLSALIGPVPADVAGGWRNAKPVLAANVVAALSRHFPGLARRLVGVEVLTPDEIGEPFDDAFGGAVDSTRLLADWRARVRTPISGLILCGAAADPVGAVSGRGGRVAAAFAFEERGRK